MIVSPTRNILIAGLLAATIIPTAMVSNAYADNRANYNYNQSRLGSMKDTAVINVDTDGNVVASRSFTRISDTSTSEVSRSESRSIIEKGTWGGIEDINIVQTKSAEQNDATKKLQDAITNAQSVLDSSNGKANDNDRKSLQDIINESNSMTSDVYLTVNALNNQTSKVNDAANKVSDAVNAYNAHIAAITSANNTGNSNAGSDSRSNSNPVKQGNYDEWVASHPDSPMGEKVLEYAKQFNGYPYVWAAAGPDAFDCSGLVMYVYAHFGVQLAHYSGYQMNAGTGVSDINHATYGDIIASSSHAALFAGFDSDGEPIVFNALNPQAGVTYTKLKYAFPNGYVIRRIFN